MAWVDDGYGGWQWQDETGQIQPGPMPSDPPPSAAATPAATGSTTRAAAAGVVTTGVKAAVGGANSVGPRPGQPVPGRPGWEYVATSDGSVRPKMVDQAAEYAGQVQQAPEPRPTAPTNIDPVTGRPIGAPPPKPVDPNFGKLVGAGRGATGPTGFSPPPAPPAPTQPQAPYQPQVSDYSGVDEEMSGLRQARDQFYQQLDKLSGVDPFGNQAFLQKATDRAVAQASGTAAMARGGAAALAGANRAAQGVQAQTTARGIQEMGQLKAQDARQAAQLGIETVKGIESVSSQLTNVELKKVDQAAQQAELNLRAYLGGRELDQAERNSLRQLSAEMAKVDLGRYQTDMDYRKAVDANVTQLLTADKQLAGIKAQIDAEGSMSSSDWAMGLLGLGAGVAQGFAMKSDRRSKFDIHDPDLRDLQDYLGKTKGKLYRYKHPTAPGQRAGLNFGPMAQDLAKSKIGKTVVVEGKDGLYVDTGRLALADHAALAALAAEVEKLKGSRK